MATFFMFVKYSSEALRRLDQNDRCLIHHIACRSGGRLRYDDSRDLKDADVPTYLRWFLPALANSSALKAIS